VDKLDVEAGPAEQVGEVSDARALVARRVDAAEPDQALQQRDRVGGLR
jgi:hypothetical protein